LINRCTDVYEPIGENRFWWWFSSTDLFIDSVFYRVCVVHPDVMTFCYYPDVWNSTMNNKHFVYAYRCYQFPVFYSAEHSLHTSFQVVTSLPVCYSVRSTLFLAVYNDLSSMFKRLCFSRLHTTATPPDVMFKTQDFKTIYKL
jgi:hypothetical protein